MDYQVPSDVALVGFPNAGKSSLLAALTSALPKIAAYPFTTVNPYVGVVTFSHTSSSAPGTYHPSTSRNGNSSNSSNTSAKEGDGVTVADLPGLVEGAHLNRGKGHAFLKHLDRAKVICYVIDLVPRKTTTMKLQQTDSFVQMSPIKAFETLREEIELFDPNLLQKPAIVVANKMDLAPAFDALNKFMGHLYTYHPHLPLFPVSAKKELNLDSLKSKIFSLIYPPQLRSSPSSPDTLPPSTTTTIAHPSLQNTSTPSFKAKKSKPRFYKK